MKDSVIFGSGNSRYLKSVENFKTLYPTYDDFAAALVAGTLPIDLNGINATGFQQLGDALGKATLLKDATAALYGMTEDAVPDDVFSLIRGQSLFKASVATDEILSFYCPDNIDHSKRHYIVLSNKNNYISPTIWFYSVNDAGSVSNVSVKVIEINYSGASGRTLQSGPFGYDLNGTSVWDVYLTKSRIQIFTIIEGTIYLVTANASNKLRVDIRQNASDGMGVELFESIAM